MKIAFLGLGRMGRELAAHILDGKHNLTVWNRTAPAADDLVARGARRADTAAAAVDDADLIITVLFGADAVRDVVMSPPLPITPGTSWVDVTTVSPADAQEFGTWARDHDVRYAHSPVIGSLVPARNRALGVLIGGDPRAVELATPIVSLWADPTRLRIYDTATKAATDKLVNNLSLAVTVQGLVEALRLGHSGGLSTEQILAALDKSMLSPMKDLKDTMLRSANFANTQFSADLLHKDASLMVQTSHFPLPAVSAAYESLENAIRDGRGEEDFAVITAGDTADVGRR